jgi:hypothetical protein
MEGGRAWKETMVGSRRDAEVTKETSPQHEAVRGIDPWWYEVSLPDVDPVFQSSCCGNSYCKKVVKDHHGIGFPKNCIPVRLRRRVAFSMVLNGLNQYNTHQLIVFK